MREIKLLKRIGTAGRLGVYGLVCSVLAFYGLFAFLQPKSASAAQLTDRKATINKSKVSATDVEHLFSYNIPNTTNTKAGITYSFCTTALGACTLPTGMSVQAATHDGQSGWPTNGTAFAAHAVSDENDCSMTTNSYIMCFERDEAVATGTTGGAVTHTISNITAPSSIQTVYLRIALYSDDDFQSGDKLDEGTVAVAFVDQLTVNGRVMERLEFCVAAVGDGGATDTTLPASVSVCSAITESAVDLGVIDSTAISRTPVNVAASNPGADDEYGIAMVNTNAGDGVTIAYFPEPDTGEADQQYAFRVPSGSGGDCSSTATSVIDQCFISATSGGDGDLFAAGTEDFGMHIPCIDTSQSTVPTSNLASVPNDYNNADGNTAHDQDCENDDAGQRYSWSVSSTALTIASSTTVVDDEIVKLRFGATAAATTPTGSYTVVTNFIATPTY